MLAICRFASRFHFNRPLVHFSVCVVLLLGVASTSRAGVCTVTDSGGTADLPPAGCTYTTPEGDMQIVDGLPVGTTIGIDAFLDNFFNVVSGLGGNLGGERETYNAELHLPMTGTGTLGGYSRDIVMYVDSVSDSASRTPGDAVQTFQRDMFSMSGEIIGDPDFKTLRINAGTNFGLPSPGSTTLTRLGPPGSDWNVDSFFDMTYSIEFQGALGSDLEGTSGTTTGTVRFQTGLTVPEPTSVALSALGVAILGVSGRRRGRSLRA